MRDRPHGGQQVLLAGRGQLALELDGVIEVILQRALVPPRHQQDVIEAGGGRLFHDVLDGRLVNDGQHLLGLSLGRGQEPSSEPSGGDDRLPCTHAAVLSRR